MTLKRPKTKQTKAAADPARVAIFSPHPVKGSVTRCDALVVALTGTKIECIAAQSWEGASCLADAHGWAAEQLAARTVMLLDGADVISRTMALPPASPDQLEMALRLQVENVMLGGAARWRTGAAVLPSNDPDRERVALMVDWPVASDGPPLPSCFGDAREVLYAPPIAALAALTLATIARGSHESMCLLLQRESGGISLAYSNGIKIALRTALEDGRDLSAWKEAVVRTVAESLMMLELPDAALAQTMAALRQAIDKQPDGLLLPCGDGWSAVAGLASGVSDRSEWQQRFGVALGCAVALTSSLARLLSLRLKAEAESAQWWLRMLRTLERPTVAAKLGVAALLALALVPMGVARGRLAYLEWQVPDQKLLRAQMDRADKERQIYEEISHQATPVTKLLGDLASCTPEGIEVTGITIDQQGQQSKVDVQAEASRSEGARGTKEPFQLVNLMQQWLRESKVFEKIEKSTEKADSNGVVSFNLTMSVKDPVRIPAYKAEQDFAAKSLRERRYGPPPTDPSAAGSASAASSSMAPSDTAAVPAALPSDVPSEEASPAVLGSAAPAAAADAVVAADSGSRRSGTGSGRAPGAARTRERSAESSKPSIPPPLTDAQIGSMTEVEAKEAVGRIATAKNAAGLDEETRDRLKREFDAVMRRLREVKK
ncbi:MAG: hypothetical protein FJ256_01580 [Phycisphaerae bacterium]|nr:hypothetical protein [Phycisphaerae bacterium]